MKKLRTILLTTAMAAAMTTGAFAATCPTTTSPINYGTAARQIQALNLSNFKTSFNLKSTNLSDLCKELKLTDWYSQISKCSDSNVFKRKSCIESIKSNCNLSDSCKNGTQSDTCTPAEDCKPNACKPVEEDKAPVKTPVTPPVETPVTPPVEAPVETPEEKPSETAPVVTEEAQFVAEVVRLVNVERKKAGLNELTVDSKISAAALVRSKEQQQSFSHTRPDGTSCFTALKEQGVTYRGAGENIAMGQRTPAEVMEGWMNSPGHKANILNANFTKIGVGYYKTNGRAYWTQMFTY